MAVGVVAERDRVDAHARRSASASFGVMPIPPAAFSPLTTTNVGACSSRSAGSSVSSVRRPARPTTSPTNRIEVATRHARRRYRASTPERHPLELIEMAAAARSRHAAARPRGAGAAARAGCSSCCCRWRCSASWPSCAPPGVIVLLFIVAGLIALLLNPFVALLRRARFPRGLAVLAVMASRDPDRGRASASCWPTRSPTRSRRSRTTCRGSSTTRTPRWPTSRTGWTATGSTCRSRSEGQTALQTLGQNRLARLGRAGLVHQRRAADPGRGLDRADPGDRAVSVYMLLYGERIGQAVRAGRPARRRHARGRLPDADPGARCSATCAASCCSR